MSSKFTRFVILLNNIEGPKTTEATTRAHVAYLRKLDKEGKLVMCGSFTIHNGGMVIITASNFDEAKQIAKSDPFVREGVRAFEVWSWDLSCEKNNHMVTG